ncbi:hypothetical protein BDV97DRAFT_305419 [Delphinella strobiligena]|nr:hypothetical protein BDV97DRAFT_305419 [Delphinella strobiligena]
MALDSLLAKLGEEIEDAAEETFLLFSQPISSHNLGMISPNEPMLDLTISNHDFTIKQSPAVLNSTREGGTTGAVVWKVTPRFATWLSSPSNIIFTTGLLSQDATVLELGSGIAGIVPVLLAPKIARYIASDQSYALKLLKENVDSNSPIQVGSRAQQKTPRRVKVEPARNITVVPLDWETDDVESLLKTNGANEGLDLLLACDCIYNYALIKPFVQTCVDVCQVRRRCQVEALDKKHTLCVIAQQLRQPDVFEEWLAEFTKSFRVWRLPDELLTPDLREGSGFVIHLGVLKNQ